MTSTVQERITDLTKKIDATSKRLAKLATEINADMAQVEKYLNQALPHAIKVGEKLNEAKALCGHGGWGAWLDANFKGSRTTATNYMRLAANQQAIADLELGGVVEAIDKIAKPKPTPKPTPPCTPRSTARAQPIPPTTPPTATPTPESVDPPYAASIPALELSHAVKLLQEEQAQGQPLNDDTRHVLRACVNRLLVILGEEPKPSRPRKRQEKLSGKEATTTTKWEATKKTGLFPGKSRDTMQYTAALGDYRASVDQSFAFPSGRPLRWSWHVNHVDKPGVDNWIAHGDAQTPDAAKRQAIESIRQAC